MKVGADNPYTAALSSSPVPNIIHVGWIGSTTELDGFDPLVY
jgi:hypothetical protein